MYWNLTLPHSKVRPESTWNHSLYGFCNKGFNLTDLLTLVEVYTALELPGGVVNVVLKDKLAGHRAGSQLEPSPPPFLRGRIIFDSINIKQHTDTEINICNVIFALIHFSSSGYPDWTSNSPEWKDT